MDRLRDYDPYEIEEPSDEEPGESSSEDEVDVLLHGTPEQKRKLIREYLTGESESSSDDEFEKEMEAELTSTMKAMEGSWKSLEAGSSSGPEQAGTAAHTQDNCQEQYYDEIYFDSDSEDEDKEVAQGTKNKRKQKHRIPTNDELLYDPKEDERDQAWVDARRRGYRRTNQTQQQQQAAPSSDAVLNCPACMTTLCLECQRHESYKTQYRAMFVMNCTVVKNEILQYKPAQKKQKKHRHKKLKVQSGVAQEEEQEIYHPVKCTECATEVAVYDKEEVYHFFNVLASHN
ncbi:E2F-associated phosphoprotein [Rhinatrema bivittatum]|uniref:E2F-associated phosphoprotein n=1 Tax=Rhinatrema bivittatum TaxID=194408 RepID=UPI00112DB98F|nr:E2F-associated phosphoprotein [Rhinatrema bivittatum]